MLAMFETENLESYFPIKIRLTQTLEDKVCETPQQVPAGEPFIVLETRDDRYYESVRGC